MVQAVGGATPSGGIKSGYAGGRDGHLCPMGSLDPRRCATPQAVAKLQTARPVAARREERSGPGVGGVEAGRQALADDSTSGRLLGAEGRSGSFWRKPRGPAKGFQNGATGRARGKRLFRGTEWSGAVAGRRQQRRRKRKGGAWNDGFREGQPIRQFRVAGGLCPAGRICQAAPTGAEPGRCGHSRRKGSAPRSRRGGKGFSHAFGCCIKMLPKIWCDAVTFSMVPTFSSTKFEHPPTSTGALNYFRPTLWMVAKQAGEGHYFANCILENSCGAI